MKTIHAITSGSYSDYRVHVLVNGGEEEAQKLADRMNRITGSRYDYAVRPFDLLEPGEHPEPKMVRTGHPQTGFPLVAWPWDYEGDTPGRDDGTPIYRGVPDGLLATESAEFVQELTELEAEHRQAADRRKAAEAEDRLQRESQVERFIDAALASRGLTRGER